MLHLMIRRPGQVRGLLLALGIALLPGLTASDAKEYHTPKSGGRAVTSPAGMAKPECGGITVSGPSSASRGSTVTFSVSNWSGQCITWYYKGTYTNTYNGSFTLTLDQYTTGDQTVNAIQHSNCTPFSAALYCGFKTFNVY